MPAYNKHQFPGKPDPRSLRQRNWDAGQYPLFMDADDLTDPSRVSHVDLRDHEGVDQLEHRKVREAADPAYRPNEDDHFPKDWEGSLLDSIAAEGVKTPVYLTDDPESPDDRLELGDGHHRAFAAKEVQRRTGQPVWVPHILASAQQYWPA